MKNSKANTYLQKDIAQIQPKTRKALAAGIGKNRIQILMDGELFPCIVPNSFSAQGKLPAVGDRVEVERTGSEDFRLVRLLPRENTLVREDRHSPGRQLTVAANAQFVIAVTTAEYLLHQSGFPERAAIAAKRGGMVPILFLSKWDLVRDEARRLLKEKLRFYSSSFRLICTSSSHKPPKELLELLRGKTAVLLGERSWGKTTLAHSLFRCLGVSYQDNSPPPSTHSPSLLSGPDNTFLIDTPGFREFPLPGVTQQELEAVFPEITGAAKFCRYSDCSHTHEESCGVLDALRREKIARERYEAYQKLCKKPAGTFRKEKVSAQCEKTDYRHNACNETFICKVCGAVVGPDGAGSQHRNHCPKCLSSLHVDIKPGDRASLCKGIMEPIGVWARKGGEWAVIHRCRLCGELRSNRIAADDNLALLLSLAVRPLASAPFPLSQLENLLNS